MRVDCWIVASIKSIFDNIPLFDGFFYFGECMCVCIYFYLFPLALVCVSRHVLNIQKWPVSKKYRKIWFYFGVFLNIHSSYCFFGSRKLFSFLFRMCSRNNQPLFVKRFHFFARRFYFAVVLLLFASCFVVYIVYFFPYFWYENQLLAIRNHYIWVNVCAECVYSICMPFFVLFIVTWMTISFSLCVSFSLWFSLIFILSLCNLCKSIFFLRQFLHDGWMKLTDFSLLINFAILISVFLLFLFFK